MKKYFMKRAAASFLSAAMVISLLPTPVLAAGESAEARSADTGKWKLQEWGGSEEVEAEAGWLTLDEDGDGFILDYAKLIEDRGKEGIVVYDSEAEAYADSTLEFDLTLTQADAGDGADQAKYYSTAVLPRFQSGGNCEGLGIHDTGHLEHTAQDNGTERFSWVRGDEGDFVFGETYHLKVVTEDNTMTVSAAKDGEELQQIASFNTIVNLDESGYGFRIWRGAKTVTVDNIVRTEIESSDPGDSGQVDLDGWVVQRQSDNQNVELQDGWITRTENGNGIVIDYGKMIEDTGQQGWVVFDSNEEYYQNSSLEYDITFSDSEDGDWIATALASRVTDGANYEGFAITNGTGLERTGRLNGSESYAGITNIPGVSFEYNTTYHLRMETIGNNITVYLTQNGVEEKLAAFESPIGLNTGTFGFRIWRGGKKITLENIKRTEIVNSTLDRNVEQIEEDEWGQSDVLVPVHFGNGDSIESVYNGDIELILDQDYMVEEDALILKKEYIASQSADFRLQVNFTKGSTAVLWVMKYDPLVQQEYTWTPDQGLDMWTKLDGSGTFELAEDGMRVTGRNLLVNELAPLAINGEIEFTFEFLNDNWERDQKNHGIGGLFRVDQPAGAWQSLAVDGYVSSQPVWRFLDSDGASADFTLDGDCFVSRDGVKDYKVKVRYENDSLTLWMDDQVAHMAGVEQAEVTPGNMGLMFNGDLGDILVKKVVFREVNPLQEETGERQTIAISNDGLTVNLDADFPRVKDYEFNGKTMNGSELRYNYVTINSVNIPAAAEITEQSSDSATYHVIPDSEQTGVTFDVVFHVQEDQTVEMFIRNINEPEDEPVNSIGLPKQPLISANSTQAGAKLDASWVFKGPGNWGIQDIHETIADRNISTTAPFAVAIPIITTDELSASMFNNVYLDGDEFVYSAFNLPDGEVTAGFWNNEFMYRGLDGEKILPFASEPDEEDLYCRIVITEDTNDDGQMDWQDGANALKKLTSDAVPGGEEAARRFFHVGYNFASGAQQPFLKVADNMKRLSNYMDGFGQNLVFKGYANEGHDSGHADYEDINSRAGGADGMNAAIAEADKINSDFGIHINHAEAYPEAKMFTDHTVSGMDGWRWMDQSKYIRRDVDMIEGTFDERLNELFAQTPDLDFIYVDCWEGDRWGELKLIGNMLENGAEMFATENAPDLQRFGVWVHSTGGTSSNGIHQFVYNTQKDIYPSSSIYWGGYSRGVSMMSWQHNNNINSLVEQFYTNQLPQKYLMCHDVLKAADGVGIFDNNVTSSNWVITKDGNKITDGQGKIFIPWYDEESETRDPDEAAKIYHWNSDGGETTWTLPESWSGLANVYLYKTTQNGKELVDTIDVQNNQITLNAEARTPYVVYPGEAAADETDWSVGSPLKDTGFNSRDFSIWQKDGEADIQFNDDGNGVSILTISGTEAGEVSQTMEGLEGGQKYRVIVEAGAANGKTARLTVETPDGEVHENYVDQVVMANQYFDNYAKGKMVQRMWVDFVQPEGETTAKVTLSGDVCESADGVATFMETRIVETEEPDLPEGYVANETFEYVEQGAYGIFNPERSADGVPHLSETHLPYTNDTISGDWSLKLYGHYGQGDVTVRTSPSTMRLQPNREYELEFDTLGSGKVYVQSESDGTDQVLNAGFSVGHSKFTFATGDKADYIVRIERGSVLDNFTVKDAGEVVAIRTEFPTAATSVSELMESLPDTIEVEYQGVVSETPVVWNEPTEDDSFAGFYTVIGKLPEFDDKEISFTAAINVVRVEAEDYTAESGTQFEDDPPTYVAYIDTGDWMEYTVTIPRAGYYALDYLIAANGSSPITGIEFVVNGEPQITTPLEGTGGWQNWQNFDGGTVRFAEAGEYTIRLNVVEGGWNIDRFDLTLLPAEEFSTAVLEYALSLAETADTEGVVDSVVKIFNDAKAAAEDILARAEAGDPSVTQEMVDESWQNLIKAMQYLSFKQGDKTDLQKVIDMAKSLDLNEYLDEGKQAFTDALAAAEAVLANGDAMQDEVDQSWRDLLKAMSELRLKPNKDALKDLIDEANGMSTEGADEETIAAFQDALAAAMSVYDNEQAKEEEVAAAEEDLQAALDQLRAAVGDTEDPDNSGSDGNTGNGGSSADTSDKDNASAQTDTTKNNSAQKSVKTGDTAAPIVGAAAAMMMAVAAGVIAYRRRRETR